MNTVVYNEMMAIVRRWIVWFTLGNQDIKLRYRRSSIGPFWITISMAVTVYSMGFLYGRLFKVNLTQYYPHLAAGIIGWSLISTLLIEGSSVFIESENYIRNQESFMSLFIMRVILRNIIVFFHNLIVFIPIIFIFHTGFGFKMLLLVPGLLIIAFNGVCWGTLLGIVGTRYRDFAQIINSLVQVVYFMTPIMWLPSSLPSRYHWLVVFNPINQFLELLRAPLMNQAVRLDSLLVVGVVSIIGFVLYAYFMKKYKHRIVFWL